MFFEKQWLFKKCQYLRLNSNIFSNLKQNRSIIFCDILLCSIYKGKNSEFSILKMIRNRWFFGIGIPYLSLSDLWVKFKQIF